MNPMGYNLNRAGKVERGVLPKHCQAVSGLVSSESAQPSGGRGRNSLTSSSPYLCFKGEIFFRKMRCAYLALGLLLLPAVTLIMCDKWWHTEQTGLRAHVIVLHYQSDNQKEQELWLLNWSISRFYVVDITIYTQMGIKTFLIFSQQESGYC